jgi:ComF family protein
LKYSGYKSLGIDLGERAAVHFPFEIDTASSVIVPIPLYPTKQRERGYNQSVYIARGICNVIGGKIWADLLKRVKNTRTQTQLDAAERRANMQNAFVLNEKYRLEDVTSVVLVDDVYTTGATLDSAAAVLRQQGVSQIFGFTVAAPL